MGRKPPAVLLKIRKPDPPNMEMVAVGLPPGGGHNATPPNMAFYHPSPQTGEGATAQTRLDGTKLGQWCSEAKQHPSVDSNARHPMWRPGVANGKACMAKARGIALAEAIRDSMLTLPNLGATTAGSNTAPDAFLARHPRGARPGAHERPINRSLTGCAGRHARGIQSAKGGLAHKPGAMGNG